MHFCSRRVTLFLMMISLAGLLFCTAQAQTAVSPLPPLTLPGPNGVSFVFRPILVKGGSGPLAGQSFIMGDPSGDFRTPPTKVVLGGAFSQGQNRFYYMGQCEITEAQYRAVMGEEAKKPATQDEMPVTGISYFDAVRFTDKLNQWLYANALQALPKAGDYPAFVRLPTEEEWEFAARGGTMVDAPTFDAETPYGDGELAAFEWFAGPDSSHNKVQQVGKLKANPLGLHDMLGNVQEMTLSLYRVEYYQGRSGGFAARGGHYLTEEDDMVSAKRSEEPFYLGSANKGMRPNTKPTLGFRLVLACPILTDRQAIAAMDAAWKNHRSGAGGSLPAAVSVASVAKQEEVPAHEALKRLQRIREALDRAGLSSSLKQEISGTEAALLDIAKIRRKADEDSARVWVKIAGERGMYLSANLRGLEVTRDAPTEHLRSRAEQFAYNVRSGLENYAEILAELAKLPKDAVLSGFAEHEKTLTHRLEQEKKADKDFSQARIKDLSKQIKRLGVTRRHYERYEKEKRLDAEGWKKDYATENDT